MTVYIDGLKKVRGGTGVFGSGANLSSFSSSGHLTMAGTSKVYKTRTFTFDQSAVLAAGKPTEVFRGVFSGFSLPIYNSDNEELFTCRCMDNDWDGSSDLELFVGGWLDTANDTKKFRIQVSVETCDFENNGVIGTDVVSENINVTTGNWAQYTSFIGYVTFTQAAIGLTAGMPLAIRIRRIDADDNEIAGEVVVMGAKLRYKANKIGLQVS